MAFLVVEGAQNPPLADVGHKPRRQVPAAVPMLLAAYLQTVRIQQPTKSDLSSYLSLKNKKFINRAMGNYLSREI